MSAIDPNLPWHDRFNTPDSDELIEPVRTAETGIEPFEQLRVTLVESLELTETLGWHGIPWRWAFSYAPREEDPIAYLVPEPGRPQFCCRLDVDAADAVAASKPHRTIREGLARGRLVGSTLWTEWDLNAMTRAGDYADLVKVIAKHRAGSGG